ncbi:E3 ubiquitin-protein ligase NRDP1 [Tyrophagus putrescentiae]|nr:E3 ubiquitin-protein ligase NRDP1 [Tyrophagus putrescentiae]
MGYDTEQFEGPIAEELICVICTGVLADPVTTHCDHLFCAACINDWLRQNRTCPIDRGPLRACMLRPPARALRNLINRLPIHCDFRAEGCPEVLPLEAYTAHLAGCVHNPARLVRCRYYCKRTMTAKAMRTHNCVSRLIELTAALEETNRRLANERQMLLYVVAILLFFLLLLEFPRLQAIFILQHWGHFPAVDVVCLWKVFQENVSAPEGH